MRHLVLTILLALCLASPGWPQASGGNTLAAADLRPTERWILQRIAAGELADLKEKFGAKEESRRVRAAFLARLLTGSLQDAKISYKGIRISQAIVSGSLDLENAEVNHWVEFMDCQFADGVILRDSQFKKGLTLSRCRFAQKAEFRRLRVMLSANFSESVFQGPLDLWQARIEGSVIANGLRCEAKETWTNFSSMHIGQAAFFSQAVFLGPVTFSGSRVGDVAQFIGAAFGGPVNFFGARIGSQLAAIKAQFAADADFGCVNVGSQFIADEAVFHSASNPINFNGLKVAHTASFKKAVFSGPVNFVTAMVGSEFNADGAQFNGTTQEADFNDLEVAHHAFFRETVFKGPANFSGAQIGGELALIRAKFLCATQPVSCKKMKVGATAYLWEAGFAGGLDLSGARFHNLLLGCPPERPNQVQVLKLENAVIERGLNIEHIGIGTLEAKGLTVKEWAHFKAVKLTEKADLRECGFGALTFQDTTWPANSDALWLEGLTYRTVNAGEGTNWQALLSWIDKSRYDTRAYNQLETYFKQGGHKDQADEIYIQGKRREVLQKWWRPDNLATLIFWDFLAGYGRKPGRTVLISLAIVLLGMLVFDPQNFDPTFVGSWNWLDQGGLKQSIVVRFFLSLDQFLPGIDLGLAKLWQLSKISFGELIYYHFHKISGWILIPIGLAAIYSQFK